MKKKISILINDLDTGGAERVVSVLLNMLYNIWYNAIYDAWYNIL